jgi:hypothetical protein
MESGRKLFKQMEDSSKVDIELFREFRKGVRNELFYIIFKCCYLLYYIFSFSGKVFKARKKIRSFEEDFDRSGVGGLNGI